MRRSQYYPQANLIGSALQTIHINRNLRITTPISAHTHTKPKRAIFFTTELNERNTITFNRGKHHATPLNIRTPFITLRIIGRNPSGNLTIKVLQFNPVHCTNLSFG